jgi:lipopolysaccharide export system protein LptA
MVSRVIAVLALLLALLAPSVAQDRHPEGRIAATFYQAQGAAQRSKAAALPDSAFKADPEVPIHIEADRLVEVFGGAKQAVFTGIVKLQRGDFQLRTVALTAFYSGQSGFSTGGEWRAEQLTRGEARERVLIMSKDGQTRATADWATFDVMANTVLMGDDVSVSRRKNVAQGPRFTIDLTTGMYPYGQKIRTARKVGQLCHSAWARRALSVTFLGRSMVPIANRRANGEAHGVGTHPGLHQRDGGPGAAAAE